MSVGDARVEPFMHKFKLALSKMDLDKEIKVDLYNRAYEAVYAAIKRYASSHTNQEPEVLNLNKRYASSHTNQEPEVLNLNRKTRRKLSKLNRKEKMDV